MQNEAVNGAHLIGPKVQIWDVLWEASIVPEHFWLQDLLPQDPSNSQHCQTQYMTSCNVKDAKFTRLGLHSWCEHFIKIRSQNDMGQVN